MKAHSYLLSVVLFACVVTAPFPSVKAQGSDEATVTLNFRNVDIHSFIQAVSLHTGTNFIVDPRVRATINIVSGQAVDADQLYEVFLSVLAVHGYAAVPAGNLTKIVPTTVAIQSAIPVGVDPGQAADKLVTEVVQLRNVRASEIVAVLQPLVSASGNISAESASNSLVLTERVANIERLLGVIADLDGG